MIQKFKDELQKLSVDSIINRASTMNILKCSLMGIFILVKDESNTLILAL
jgi:hypothetical protein